MSKIWLISDTHLSHHNIIKYTNRPFSSTDEMNQTILNNWNRVVSEDDIVFHLGDFALGMAENRAYFASQLKGKKRLILGNHDLGNSQKYLDIGFQEVYKYPIVFQQKYILSHRPLDLGADSIFYNIHGHIHNNPSPSDRHANVSVEQIDYTPIEFRVIVKKLLKGG